MLSRYEGITATLRATQHSTAWFGMVPVDLSGVIERAGLASLVHDGLALEQRQEVWWLLALGDADLAEEKRGERDEIGRGKEMGRGEERKSGCE
jgi:hypothetical protein